MLTRRNAAEALALFLVGAGSAIVGLLPWLITGMRLPLQNLWATSTPQGEMPITLLPFSQYAVTLIVAVVVTGSALAGAIARAWRTRLARFAMPATIPGVLSVQSIATVQTAITVSGGLIEGTASDVYLAALVVGTVAAILIGLLVLLVIATARRAGATVAASIAAVAFGTWLNGIVIPFGSLPADFQLVLLTGLRWIPAILVGLAIAWCGVATVGRVAAAVGSLLVLWIAPSLFTAVSSAAGTRVLARYPAELAEYTAQVFVSALGIQGGSLSLVVLAVLVAIAALAVRRVLARRAQ